MTSMRSGQRKLRVTSQEERWNANTRIVGAYSRGPNFGGSGHLVLFLVVVYFIKRQTLPNNIPEGNLLKSVYLTPKIAFISMPLMAQLYTFLFPHFYSNCITTNLSVVSNNQE